MKTCAHVYAIEHNRQARLIIVCRQCGQQLPGPPKAGVYPRPIKERKPWTKARWLKLYHTYRLDRRFLGRARAMYWLRRSDWWGADVVARVIR